MKYSDITDWFMGAIPVKRKSALDWLLPASIGMGIGVAAGVGIGMILAPRAGEETRQMLKDQAYRMKDRALDAANRVRGELASSANKLERSFVKDTDRTYSNDLGKVG